MAGLLIFDADGGELARVQITDAGEALNPFPYDTLRDVCARCPEGSSLALEIDGGAHLVPLGTLARLSDWRLPAFAELIVYKAAWYERDVLAGKRILPWHENYFNADTDAGNLAVHAMADRVLLMSIDQQLDADAAVALLDTETGELAERQPMAEDTVVRDLVLTWLRKRNWVGSNAHA